MKGWAFYKKTKVSDGLGVDFGNIQNPWKQLKEAFDLKQNKSVTL